MVQFLSDSFATVVMFKQFLHSQSIESSRLCSRLCPKQFKNVKSATNPVIHVTHEKNLTGSLYQNEVKSDGS